MEITEKAPAKLNLFLDTPFNHPDGLQEWNMVMTSVDLADYVKINVIPNKVGIKVKTNTGFLPNDSRNLAYQAARILQERFKIRAKVMIEIRKHIPVAAGMGGGSSDAAAVLRGLNRIWELGLSLEELAKIGLEIDSDVPFCVYGQTAHVVGKGEQVIPLKKLPPMWIVIAKPKLSVSTPYILNKLNHDNIQHLKIERMLDAIDKNDFDGICASVGNVLEQVTGKEYPEILQIKERMVKYGANAAQMSGTGPTVFGICSKSTRAKHIVNSLKGFCHEVYLVRTL
ncbi:4-(cytidine 5'-diphospho)-2-C-methyl-D-erythritol kinase [Pediococcus argentinicus]|uniref:4-(cytidine 5'-diphospho)-2-C-methyl-D-erythritol kinase n=1 Tax=Pediococcus argentinicus TaxID=480391 RepID=UPI00338E61B4